MKFDVQELILHDFRGSGALLETCEEQVPKNTSNCNSSQTILGGYFGPGLLQSQIFVHLFGVSFYANFRHCFWEASGSNLDGFWIILGPCWGHFAHFLADAAELPKCNPSQAKCLFLGFRASLFASFSLSFRSFFLCWCLNSMLGRFW